MRQGTYLFHHKTNLRSHLKSSVHPAFDSVSWFSSQTWYKIGKSTLKWKTKYMGQVTKKKIPLFNLLRILGHLLTLEVTQPCLLWPWHKMLPTSHPCGREDSDWPNGLGSVHPQDKKEGLDKLDLASLTRESMLSLEYPSVSIRSNTLILT